MTKKTKTTLFFSLVAIFIIIAPLLILYSQGYRFDFQKGKIIRTGGLFLKISPSGSNVYIDHRLTKKTNFVFDSVFLNNLLPKKYHILVKKDGYYSWNKTLEIEEAKVTEAKNIVLFKKDITPSLVAENIDDFFVSPSKKDIILKKKTENGWELYLFNLENQNKELLLKSSDFYLFSQSKKPALGASLVEIIWSSDSKKILLNVEIDKLEKFFIFDLSRKNNFAQLSIGKNKIIKAFFNPKNSEEIIFLEKALKQKVVAKTELILFDKDLREQEIDTKSLGDYNILDIANTSSYVFWLSESGFVYKGIIENNKLKILEVLNLKPINISPWDEYKLKIQPNENIFLLVNKTLFYLDPFTHNFKWVLDNVENIKLSLDSKILGILTNNQIWLFWLKDDYQQPQRMTYDKLPLLTSNQKLNDLFWFDLYHIIFTTPNSVKITEIDNRSNLNVVDIVQLNEPEIFWNFSLKKLLILSKNNLFEIKF